MAENMEIMDAMDIDTKEQQFDEDIENIIDLLEEKSYFKARDEILKHNEVDIGEILEEVLEELGIEKTIILFRMLPKDVSVEVFSYLPTDDQLAIVDGITDRERNYIIQELDFDDMIGKCLELLVSHPEILSKYRNQFRYLMVDEFQDINMPQYNVVKLLAGEDANLLVVGDDDQAIYGFRGASPGVMKRFQEDFPNCTQIMLTENYRSGQEIVKLARKVIDRNKERFSKEFIPIRKHGEISFYQLESRKEEEERLIRDICVLTDEVINDSALILRTNREVFQYRELLKASGVKIKEIKPNEENIFRSFMVEDISAYLNFLYRGQKRSDFLKFMNKPNHYFTRLALLHETVNEEDMLWYYYQNETMKRTIRGYFKHLSLAKSLSPYMAVSLFRKTLGYERYIREKSESYMIYENWLKQLDKMQELLKDYGNNIDAEQFFRDLEDKQGKSERSEEKRITQGISVITMHGAKGLEFEHVFLPDVNEGIIPRKNCREASEVEEERRLLYVAITRARDSLHIYATKERNRKPSSFLNGIILPQ